MIWEIDDSARAIEGLDAQGRPDPEYARELGLLPAPFGRRVLATLIEAVVLVVLMLPALILSVPPLARAARTGLSGLVGSSELVPTIVGLAISQALVSVFVIVQLILQGRRGVTLGKACTGIRSVNVRTLERPKFWRGAVVRYLVALASGIVFLIGPLLVIALSPLFDMEKRGRGWLDLAAGTWFVDVRKGLNPYDVKRMRIARKSVTATEHGDSTPLPSLATPVDRDAPATYVPSARFSGGVIGAHRSSAPADHRPAPPVAVPLTPADPIMPPVAEPAASPTAEPAAPAVAEPAAPAPRAVLELDTGRRVEVHGAALIGRHPEPAADEVVEHTIALDDDTRSVSKTHLALAPTRRGMHVMDRGSTNGSSLVRGGAETPLVAGQSVQLASGDVVRFGDRWLRVVQA